MQHWLIKTEPGTYSFADLMAERDRTTCWNGVRNYQARNLMREMAVGDPVLVYHSSCEPPHVAGTARVARAAYPDLTALDSGSDYYDPQATADDPRWDMVDVQAVEPLPAPVPLAALKANPRLAKMAVVQRGQRLSVQRVTAVEYAEVLRMAKELARAG
jgi:predicted RNA-binding protein with PUA-like domain